MNIAQLLDVEDVNQQIREIRMKENVTLQDHCKIAKLRNKVSQRIKEMEKTIEYIGKKKWAEAQEKEKEEDAKHKVRVEQAIVSKMKEAERLDWLCRNNEDIAEFVNIVFKKGTIPSMINGHDCILKICEIIYYERSEEYWIARFREGAKGRINEIKDMANWFAY